MGRARQKFYGLLSQSQHRWHWELGLGPVVEGAARARYEMAPAPPGGWQAEEWSPIWSFDNPNIHGGPGGGSVLQALGLEAADHFELPINSCDIHRVIEHTHARLVGAFDRQFYDDMCDQSLGTHKEILDRLFYSDVSVASPEVIVGDVQKLPELFSEIIEHQGGWPPKCFR